MKINEQALRRCGQLLAENDWKLACVESMTSGFLSSVYGMEIRSGDYFLGSVVCYDDKIKEELLQVPLAKVEKYCAESAVVTLRILDGLQQVMPKAKVYVSVTGLAYDTKNPKQRRPVGTVYYAFAFEGNKMIMKRKFKGNAADIIVAACNSIVVDLETWLVKMAYISNKIGC